MPRSRKRRRRVADNLRQTEKARRKLNRIEENKEEKENELLCEQKLFVGDHPAVETKDETAERKCPGECQRQQRESEEKETSESTEGSWFAIDWGGIYNGLVQGVEVAKDVVFPSRVLKRQLDDAQERLRVMESELEEIRLREGERSSEEKGCLGPAMPLPPSAPPPPPPPPPPLPQPCKNPTRIIMTRKRTKILKNTDTDRQPAITLANIKNVKLKRVSNSDNCTVAQGRRKSSDGFAVSLADLRNVKLTKANRRKSMFPRMCSPELEFASLRKNLRKTKGAQSPRSSCLNKSLKRPDGGEGVTPMLARALRRKFQVAYPLSPVNSTSPCSVGSPAKTPPLAQPTSISATLQYSPSPKRR